MDLKKIDTKQLIIYAAIAVGVYLIYKKLTKKGGGLFGSDKAQSEIGKLIEEDKSGQIQGAATISGIEASSIASTIKGAWGLNDDEEAIYSAFRRIHSMADLLLVMEKYGYYQANLLSAEEDLETSIKNRMSRKERGKINEILKQSGIDYAF